MTLTNLRPRAWANLLVKAWGDRYPVDVRSIAYEYSKSFQDPIIKIGEAKIESFEEALLPLQTQTGWAILYNPNIYSIGRINYTLGHELGHYLCHRHASPIGFTCGVSETLGVSNNLEYKKRETEADQFSSYLLMPIVDFKKQIGDNAISLEILRHCADRYKVSLTAAALKWLEYPPQKAAIVVGINGFVDWCKTSDAARSGGIYFPRGMELPAASLAASRPCYTDNAPSRMSQGVWSPHLTCEQAVFADRYEMTISILTFETGRSANVCSEDEREADLVDLFSRSGAASLSR